MKKGRVVGKGGEGRGKGSGRRERAKDSGESREGLRVVGKGLTVGVNGSGGRN